MARRQARRQERESRSKRRSLQSYDARLRKFQEDFGKFQAEPDFAAALDVVQQRPDQARTAIRDS